MKAAKKASVKQLAARSQAYGLLARAFGRPDAEMESEVAGGRFQRALAEALEAAGCRKRAVDRARALPAPGGALAPDFARLFSPSVDGNCPPYETEYTGAHVFMRAQQLADVAGFYRAFGLQVAGAFRERPDHIAAELEFMHVVALKEALARARRQAANAGVCRRAQARFLEEHLGRWLEAYGRRLAGAGAGGFYGRLAALAREIVAWDAGRLGVAPQAAAPRAAPPAEPELACPAGVAGPGPGGDADAC